MALFFYFFVRGVLHTPPTMFFEFEFFLDFADILVRVIVKALAIGASEPYKIWLWHGSKIT